MKGYLPMRTVGRFLAVFSVIAFASSCAGATDQTPPPVVEQSTPTPAPMPPSDPLSKVSAPTGTTVDAHVRNLLEQTEDVRQSIRHHDAELADAHGIDAAAAIEYHSSVAAIEARLQQGTTKGNPILLRQWNEALADLDQVNTAIARLNGLSTDIETDGSNVQFLAEAIRASYDLTGGIDEDHANLDILRDVVSDLNLRVERMHTAVSENLLRMNNYIATERNNMQALAFSINQGEMVGESLSNRTSPAMPATSVMPATSAMPADETQTPAPVAVSTAVGGPAAVPAVPPVAVSQPTQPPAVDTAPTNAAPLSSSGVVSPNDQLLVVIRFTQDNVNYARPLYDAISAALNRMPGASFSVVAVSPEEGDSARVSSTAAAAQRHADDVKRSLIEMGMPENRMTVAAVGSNDVQAPEVRIYGH